MLVSTNGASGGLTYDAKSPASPASSPTNGQSVLHLSMDLHGQTWAERQASTTPACIEDDASPVSSPIATGSRQRKRQAPTILTSSGMGSSMSSSRRPKGRQAEAEGYLHLNVSSNRLTLARLLDLLDALPCDKLTDLNASQNSFHDAPLGELLRALPCIRMLRLSSCGLGPEGVRSLMTELLRIDEERAKEALWKQIDENDDGVMSKKELRNALRQGIVVAEDVKFQSNWLSIDINKDGMISKQEFEMAQKQGILAEGLLDSKRCCTAASPRAAANGPASGRLRTPGLEVLDLSGSSLESAVPDLGNYLARAGCTLRSLDLSYSALGPEAVRILSEALCVNTTLQVLRLAHCHLREEAVVLLGSLSAEDSCLPLRSLSLAKNQLPETSCREVGAFLASSIGTKLEELDISGNGLSEEASSRALGRGILSTGNIEGGIEMRLDLSGTRPYFNAVNGRWDATLQLLPALRAPGCRVMEVAFDQCTVSEAAMPTLARVCLNVRSFSFCSHSHGETFLHSFAELVHAALESAEKRAERQRRSSATMLANSTGISDGIEDEESIWTNVSNTAPMSPVSRQQRGLRLCLRELRLNDTALQDHSVVLLAEALEKLRSVRRDQWDLEVLEIGGNHLGVESIDALAPILINNHHLRRLVLSRNRLRYVGGARLAEWLPWRGTCAPLDLELRRCSLTAEGALQVWMGVLAEGARVFGLDLTENAIGNDCLEAMQAAMSHSRPPWLLLKKVHLLPNPCSGPAVTQFLTNLTPWQKLMLTDVSVDAPLIAQLLYCLGRDQSSEVVVSPNSSPPSSPRVGSAKGSPRAFEGAAEVALEFMPEFSLSLSRSSIVSKQWQWSIVADAVRAALASTRPRSPRSPKTRAKGAAWRRFGGCGGSLLLELDRCELSRAAFKVPGTALSPAPPDSCAATISSLARSARREIRGRTSSASRIPCREQIAAQQPSLAARARGASASAVGSVENQDCSALAADGGVSLTVTTAVTDGPGASSERSSQGQAVAAWDPERFSSQGGDVMEMQGVRRARSASACTGSNRSGMRAPPAAPTRAVRALGWTVPTALPTGIDPPQQQAWNGFNAVSASGSIGRAFERHGQPEIEVSTVMRELRGIESLCLEKCSLRDKWLTQLCTSGGSSKWSGVRLLDLRHNELTSACCSALASVVAGGLEVLIVDGNRLEACGLEILSAAVKPGGRCSLRWLSVAENGIGHPGGFVAAELLGRPGGCPLQGLSLARNPRLSSGELIAVLRGLCRQAANQTSTAAGDSEPLGRQLEVLDLSACGADSTLVPQLAKALSQCPNLGVDVRGCPMTAQLSREPSGKSLGSHSRSHGSGKVLPSTGTTGVGVNLLRELDKFVLQGRVQL